MDGGRRGRASHEVDGHASTSGKVKRGIFCFFAFCILVRVLVRSSAYTVARVRSTSPLSRSLLRPRDAGVAHTHTLLFTHTAQPREQLPHVDRRANPLSLLAAHIIYPNPVRGGATFAAHRPSAQNPLAEQAHADHHGRTRFARPAICSTSTSALGPARTILQQLAPLATSTRSSKTSAASGDAPLETVVGRSVGFGSIGSA